MNAQTARRLAHYIQASGMPIEVQSRLLDALSYAVRYHELTGIMIDTDATGGNRDLLNALWEACEYEVREDLVASGA